MRPIFAYLDPGTGSYLLQLALGGLFGAAYAVSHFWSRVKRFFGGGTSARSPRADDALS
jgi:hypothetical protein